MKNLMTLLVCATMVLTGALGAKAQFNDVVIRKVAMIVNSQINDRLNTVGEVHVTEADLAPLKDSLGVRERFLKSYTSTQVLNGKISFYRPNGRLAEKDTVMTVCALNVRKLKGDTRYDGIVVAMFGFNPKYSVPVPHVLWDYTPNTVAQTTPQGGGQGAQAQGGQPQPGSGQPAPYQPLYTFQDSLGVKYTVLYNPNGAPFVMGPNGQVAAAAPAGMQATAQTTPQGGGQKSVMTQQDSTTRSATWSQSLTTSGDPNLLAQMGTGGSQGGQQNASNTSPNRYDPEVKYFQDEDGGSIPYYVSPDGHIILLADPDAPRQFELGNLSVVYAKDENGLWAPTFTDKANGYKFGVGEFAGYRANYYRHAQNGRPLNPIPAVQVVNTGAGVGGCGAGLVWSTSYGRCVQVGGGGVFGRPNHIPPGANCGGPQGGSPQGWSSGFQIRR